MSPNLRNAIVAGAAGAGLMLILDVALRASGARPDRAAPDAVSAIDVLAESSAPDEVVYDCTGIEPTHECGEERTAVVDLVALGDQLAEVAAAHERPKPEYWARFEKALTDAETADVSGLPQRARIAAQNAALHLSFVALPDAAPLSARARDLVSRLAYPSSARPESIEPDAMIERWLGPRSEWVERTVATRPLLHETIVFKTRVQRLVRTRTLRANFSQLVAIDDAGKPYVTSVVGSIEIRRGFLADAHACVVVASASRARCDELAGLEAVTSASSLPQSHFLSHDDRGHVRCNGCHAPATPDVDFGMGARDLSSNERAATLDDRRSSVLRGLEVALHR